MQEDFNMMLEREAGMPDYVNPVAVAFGLHYTLDQAKTLEAGHNVFVDSVFVKIVTPGDRSSLFFQPATDRHKQRFPKAWESFQARQKDAGSRTGLPLEEWPAMTRATVYTLKAAHIHTVEDLAIVPDTFVDRLGVDGRGLRAQAQAFITKAADGAATMRLASEKKALEDQLAAMQAQINALTAIKAGAASSEAPADTVNPEAARRPITKQMGAPR
jgi:hypothetical protein